jgi:biopolymer transport protein ExbD
MPAVAARRHFAPAAEPNVIPFIDVLLVLLIIFMVTAPKPTSDLKVDMAPLAPSRASAIAPTIVAIRRGDAGVEYLVGSERVPLDRLGGAALAAMLAADPAMTLEDAHDNGRIFVRADLDVGYQSVVSAVDGLEHARFQHVAIAAQRADAPG